MTVAWPRYTVWRATRVETDAGVFHEVLLARRERRATLVLDPEARILTAHAHS